jgi:hypothetical protein
MNGNEKYFEQKFNECSKFIKAKPKDIVSLKYREIRDHYFYQELLANLTNIEGLEIENLGHIMNGVSYKVSYGSQGIVIVEHETGLEILYISGSIASLIALVLQVASMIGDRRNKMHSYPNDLKDVEVRYFDKKGDFIEEHRPNYLPFEIFLLPQAFITEIEVLNKRVNSLEKKIRQLTIKQKKGK